MYIVLIRQPLWDMHLPPIRLQHRGLFVSLKHQGIFPHVNRTMELGGKFVTATIQLLLLIIKTLTVKHNCSGDHRGACTLVGQRLYQISLKLSRLEITSFQTSTTKLLLI